MHKKIIESTAARPLANPNQTKLFTAPTGEYSGRRAALFMTAAGEIELAHADAPKSAWSTPQSVAADAANQTFDAVMTPAGDIHLVYSEAGTLYLATRKLTFAAGGWSAGAPVIIYNGAQSYDPSIALEPSGKLWVSWSRLVSPSRWIHAKASDDGGLTWGSGPADAGEQISSGCMFAHSKVVVDPNAVHVIYHDQDAALSICSRAIAGGSWSDQYNIAVGSGFSEDFDVAVAADGRLGVAFDRNQLFYREYDGANWGALISLFAEPVLCPQVVFQGNIPIVVFLRTLGTNANVPMYTDRRTGTFSEPAVLDRSAGAFDSVLLYDASAALYEDLTAEAASTATGDVYHSESGCLVKDSGDLIYLGMEARFRLVQFRLSTPGAGGTLQFNYWDGHNWRAFTPANGAVDLSAAVTFALLWDDYAAIPSDWQRCLVDGVSHFWLKIEVVSGFGVGPVGSQITAASATERIILRR